MAGRMKRNEDGACVVGALYSGKEHDGKLELALFLMISASCAWTASQIVPHPRRKSSCPTQQLNFRSKKIVFETWLELQVTKARPSSGAGWCSVCRIWFLLHRQSSIHDVSSVDPLDLRALSFLCFVRTFAVTQWSLHRL